VSLAGCASAETPDAGGGEHERFVQSPIIGGYLDTATHGVVALAFQGRGQVEVFCSGSLLARNLVLTARHCIAQIGDGSSEQVDCATSVFTDEYNPHAIFVSTDAQPQTSMGQLYPVQQILEARGSQNVCGYDVALLILSGAGIPSTAATPIVPVLDTPTVVKSIFSAVGFGLQDPKDTQGTTAGSRMRYDSAQVACVGQACDLSAQNKPDEWVGNSPVCSGDSGGPALDSTGRVFGVTSRGDSECSYALYSNVANWADFIRSTAKTAAATGGYTPPDWATVTLSDPLADAGVKEPDAGPSTADAGVTITDAGPPPVKGITPTVDPLGQVCNGNCPGTYQCFSSVGTPPGVCVPLCADSAPICPTDYTCSARLKVCVPNSAVEGKASVSASCAVRSAGESPDGSGWASLVVFGCAWLVRRRRNAA
jgi:MYXO-CTERM domain-containing protein